MKDDRDYLEYIRESIDRVEEYVHDGKDAFFTDFKTQDAVLRRMETLADAASHLSDTLKGRHPEIPWRPIGNFRNVLAHGYSEIRLEAVWRAVERDLPVLKVAVHDEISRLS